MRPFLFSLCLLFLFGCEKATEYNSSPRDNFEALWRIMDENYCFFAFKDVDWDEVHDRYNLLVRWISTNCLISSARCWPR